MANKEYASRVAKQYAEEVVPALTKKFGYKNPMEVPKLVKIVISSGLGDIKDNAKSSQLALNEIKQITGQQPILTKAKKSVANFKVREGMSVGIKVTLRNKMMYDFYDKFVSIALPRVRDFRGVPADSFDGKGNYNMGIKEQDPVRSGRKDPRHGHMLCHHGQDRRGSERTFKGARYALQEVRRTNNMAKKSMINKQQRPAKYSTRAYTRCSICGRPHAVLRKYGVCRICFRNLAYKGEIPGVKKSSW